MKDKKSPLKDKLLRTPGQSLDEEINKIIDDQVMTYALASVWFVVLAMFEWYRWYMDVPPSPWTFSIMALVVILFSAYKLIPLRKKSSAVLI